MVLSSSPYRIRTPEIASTEVRPASRASHPFPLARPLEGEVRTSEERESRLFYEDLLNSAQWQLREQNFHSATLTFQAISGEASLPQGLRTSAERWSHAVIGDGGFTAERFQFLTGSIVADIFRPSSLGGMLAAGLTYRVARFGLMGGFLRAGMGGPAVRGLANTLAFGAEASTFPIHTRLIENALGHWVDWSTQPLLRDIQGSFLILGGLRLARSGGTRLFNGVHGRSPITGLPTRFTQNLTASRRAFQNGSMFAGIALGHRMEQAFDLQADQGAFQLLAESLITFVHFKAAEHIIPMLSGRRLRQFEHNLESQSRSIEGRSDPGRWTRNVQNISLSGLQVPWTLAMENTLGSRSGPGEAPASLPKVQRPNLVFSLGAGEPQARRAPSAELSRLVEELSPEKPSGASALLPNNAKQFHRTLRELETQGSDQEEVNLRLAEILQADWIQRMEAVGVQVSRRPMIDFFRETFETENRKEPEWLKALAKDSTLGNLEVIEMFADAQAHENAMSENHSDTLNSFGFSTGAMDAIGKRLGLPQGTFLRVTSQDPQEFRAYLPPIPFFLKIPRIVFGDAALDYEITPALSTDQEVRDLLARGRRPWIVTDGFSNLHDTNRTHPFPAWTHDLFHILDLSQMPTEVRKALPVIYDYFSELSTTHETEAELVREILPNILEGGLTWRNSHESLFLKIKGSQTSREFQERAQKDIEALLSGR